MDKNELKEKVERLEREFIKAILLYNNAVYSGKSDETVSELFEIWNGAAIVAVSTEDILRWFEEEINSQKRG